MRNMKLLAGTSHPDLAAKMARWLNMPLTPVTVNKFSNNETNVVVDDSVRENDVFVLQTAGEWTNERVMELVIMISACKLASAKRVTAIIPLFFYSKQSKRKNRTAITGKLIASMLAIAGVDHIITMDLHASQMQGFFSVPVDNLYAEPTLASYIRHYIEDYADGVVVAKNPGGMKRVTSLADRLCIGFAMVFTVKTSKKRTTDPLFGVASLDVLSNHNTNDDTFALVDDGPSNSQGSSPALKGTQPPSSSSSASAAVYIPSTLSNMSLTLGGGSDTSSVGSNSATTSAGTSAVASQEQLFSLAAPSPSKKDKGTVSRIVGDVAGKVCFLADDMIDGIKSYRAAAKLLIESGAKRVYLVATHGVFKEDSLQEIQDDDCIHEVIVTNTVSLKGRAPLDKVKIIDISSVLAEAARRTHNGESLSFLLNNIPT